MSSRDVLETLQSNIGNEIGVAPWVTVTQKDIELFADVTRDHQYLHVDKERAERSVFGGTIAHGFFSLSLLSYFAFEGCGCEVPGATMSINYGFDRVRFLSPVPVGSRIRARSKLLSVKEKDAERLLITQEVSVEIEGQELPALAATWLTLYAFE